MHAIPESKNNCKEEFPTRCICPTHVIASTQVPASSLRAIGISRWPSGDESQSSVVSGVLGGLVIFSGGSKGQIIAWKLHVTNATPSTDDFTKSGENVARSHDSIATSDDNFTTQGDDSVMPGDDFATSSDGFWEFLTSHNLSFKGCKRLKPWKQHLYNPEVETRYMDISAFCLTNLDIRLPCHLHVVVAVCSSGVLR